VDHLASYFPSANVEQFLATVQFPANSRVMPAGVCEVGIQRFQLLQRGLYLDSDQRQKAIPQTEARFWMTLEKQYTLALVAYSAESPLYGQVNATLRKGNSDEVKRFRDFIYVLQKALQKLPGETGQVFRAVACRLSSSDRQHYSKGKDICFHFFTSASTRLSSAARFLLPTDASKPLEATLFLIQSSCGKSIRYVSAFPEEEEVLFTLNTIFHVDDVVEGLSAASALVQALESKLGASEIRKTMGFIATLRHLDIVVLQEC
jgi:hypothetical protein